MSDIICYHALGEVEVTHYDKQQKDYYTAVVDSYHLTEDEAIKALVKYVVKEWDNAPAGLSAPWSNPTNEFNEEKAVIARKEWLTSHSYLDIINLYFDEYKLARWSVSPIRPIEYKIQASDTTEPYSL